MVHPQEACGGGALHCSMDRSCTEAGGQHIGLPSRRASQAVGREPAERLAGQVEHFPSGLTHSSTMLSGVLGRQSCLFGLGEGTLLCIHIPWSGSREGSLVEAWPGDRLLRQL